MEKQNLNSLIKELNELGGLLVLSKNMMEKYPRDLKLQSACIAIKEKRDDIVKKIHDLGYTISTMDRDEVIKDMKVSSNGKV